MSWGISLPILPRVLPRGGGIDPFQVQLPRSARGGRSYGPGALAMASPSGRVFGACRLPPASPPGRISGGWACPGIQAPDRSCPGGRVASPWGAPGPDRPIYHKSAGVGKDQWPPGGLSREVGPRQGSCPPRCLKKGGTAGKNDLFFLAIPPVCQGPGGAVPAAYGPAVPSSQGPWSPSPRDLSASVAVHAGRGSPPAAPRISSGRA